MTYHGRVENGVIVLDSPAPLPEGAEVQVEVLDSNSIPTLAERFREVIGIVDDLPSDMAQRHDFYLHGQPKD